MGQIQWTVSLVTIGLFSIAIIGFAMGFAADNNAAVDLSNDPELSKLSTDINVDIDSFNTNAERTSQSIINSSIIEGGQTTQGAGSFSITPTNVIGVTTNILRVGYSKIFGSGTGFGIFISTFLGLIVFIIGMMIWKTWAGRNPE